MNSKDLTAEQLSKIAGQINLAHWYLAKLERRMEAEKFPKDDRIYQAVIKSHDAVQELSVLLHYAEWEARRR